METKLRSEDELAKQAALMDYVRQEPALGLSLANIKHGISVFCARTE